MDTARARARARAQAGSNTKCKKTAIRPSKRPVRPSRTPSVPAESRQSSPDQPEAGPSQKFISDHDLPEQLPSLPEDGRGAQSPSPEPRVPTRAERLRDVLSFKALAEAYGPTEEDHDAGPTPLQRAINEYALRYYASRGLLVPRSREGASEQARVKSRGDALIPDHIWSQTILGGASAAAARPATLDRAQGLDAEQAALSSSEFEPSDEDMGAESDASSQDSDAPSVVEIRQELRELRSAKAPARKRGRPKKVPEADERISMLGALDGSALDTVAIYIEELVEAMLGDHGL